MRSVRSSCRRLKISIQSRHSRRTVPTEGSAKAFAFGAFARREDDRDPLTSKDFIERVGKLAVAVVDQEPKRRRSLGKRPREVACLRDPYSARVLGATGQLRPTTPKLDE